MAEGGGEFGYVDPDLDDAIDNDYDDESISVPSEEELDTTRPFLPGAASTPYNSGEQIKMQTMQHEQSGMPSYVETTPLLPGSDPVSDADIERRLAALRQDPITGIINTTQMMDTSINPLSDEDRAKQIEKVKDLIKKNYPKVNFENLVIGFSKKSQ